ncbi:DUF6078 family protein [Prevotella sp. FD3004]|uniref:DUF6078 family protein n=1 Tax=Prevotella sp. FD3004 TaxID=1408309 RepID=UPI00068D89A4|nr:DUF6078 family protein [Prevotella sp. FD3004]
MNMINFKEVPDHYLLCMKEDCPMADHCLRQMAMHVLTKHDKVVKIANPLLTHPSERCKFYRPDEPQGFARGFAAMQEKMLPHQYSVFMKCLQQRFGRTGYFERRRGDRLCSPDDIKAIKALLEKMGLQHLEFEAYELHHNWND